MTGSSSSSDVWLLYLWLAVHQNCAFMVWPRMFIRPFEARYIVVTMQSIVVAIMLRFTTYTTDAIKILYLSVTCNPLTAICF